MRENDTQERSDAQPSRTFASDAQDHARVRRQMEQFGAVQCDNCGWWNLPIHVCHECGFDPSMEGK